jgi:hypothetical protein
MIIIDENCSRESRVVKGRGRASRETPFCLPARDMRGSLEPVNGRKLLRPRRSGVSPQF